MDVRAGICFARCTVAPSVDRVGIFGELCVADIEFEVFVIAAVERSVARNAGWGNAVEHVDSARDDGKHIARVVADTHRIARLVVGEQSLKPVERCTGHFHVVADGFAANGDAVKRECGNKLRGFAAKGFVVCTLNNSEEELFPWVRSWQGVGFDAALSPLVGYDHGLARFFKGCAVGGADIEIHDDVGAEFVLDVDCNFGAKTMGRAVDV